MTRPYTTTSTPRNTTTAAAIAIASPKRRDPTICQAGRAHIRGKICRVWRPRYLELCASGLVRYYELPPTADVTLPEDSDLDHVHMIPKDTLHIYHARIIDVTTLRDLHVGLPRGSFGFLFRGQRQQQQQQQQQQQPVGGVGISGAFATNAASSTLLVNHHPSCCWWRVRLLISSRLRNSIH
jgi:hypothetical protein